ncbi:response regulator transcription factor [Methylosinus sp. H3A]|uniref:response regulator transcription factor n=1 Tax=Methylosinus sp. H3A TaxID=2785786 RepID=UPI0018C2F05D|nr:response regulator transcription factor [Methylosinus sp. H3A]MBG0812443.1 response regulator transcription factor [Methylosinus sp. H3A]
MRILVVEDQKELAYQIAKKVSQAGFAVDSVGTIGDALALLEDEPFSAVLLDRRLPDGDGLSLMRIVREKQPESRVLMLTALDAIDDRVEGLNAGADDYLIKPFSLDELLARIRASLRRAGGAPAPRVSIGALTFDLDSGTAQVERRAIQLQRRETALLEALIRRAERVVRRHMLMAEIYGLEEEIQPHALTILVSRLRARLDEAGAGVEIHTSRGVGYMIAEKRE